MIQSKFGCLLLASVICVLTGCGDSGPPTGELSGDVYFENELVGDCKVVLYNSATLRTVGGNVDENGKFQISEVPLGDYKVSVKQQVTNAIEDPPFDKRIPQKYRSHETSGFTVKIDEGENTTSLKMEKK